MGWVFEQARASKYTLTTYASISKVTSKENEEWEYGAEINKLSYTSLTSLTKAHRRPKDCSEETGAEIYISLPVAFLASLVLHAAKHPDLEKIEEYGFGWDSGDLLKWQPSTR